VTETRESIENRLADLHRERGYALLHGKKFDNSVIVAEHEKLAALEDVDRAKVEQEREAASAKHQADITKVRTEISDLTAASSKALAQAESNLRAAVKAQVLVHQHEKAKRQAQAKLNGLTGVKDNIDSEFELYRKGSRLWLAQLNLLTSAPGAFGDLRFPSLHLPSPDKSWT
jgi:hypothetical protein